MGLYWANFSLVFLIHLFTVLIRATGNYVVKVTFEKAECICSEALVYILLHSLLLFDTATRKLIIR